MKTWPITVLIAIAVSFGGWNALETHLMRNDLSALKQFVIDSREARLDYQHFNDSEHKKYELEMKRMEIELSRLDKEISELRVRIVFLEKE